MYTKFVYHENITFSADESLVKKARLRAAKEHTTLNQRFRDWLARYATQPEFECDYKEIISQLSYAKPGRSFTRDELNER